MKREMTAAITVARAARKQSNHSGFSARCGHTLIVTGVGKTKRPVIKAMKRAEKRTGLETRWRTVSNTRKEIRRELRRAAADPRIVWVEIPASGARLHVGTNDDALRDAPRRVQRAELGLTIRRFRIFSETWDEPATASRKNEKAALSPDV
jgi:hypothetical protein